MYPMHFIPSIATSLGSDERDPSQSVKVTDQENGKYFLYSPIKFVEEYINMLPSDDSLLI